MTLGWLKLEFRNCSRVGYNFLPVPCPVCPTEGWGSTQFRSLLREGSDLGSAGWAKPRTGKRRWSKQPVNIRDHLIQNKIYSQCSSSLEILLNIKSTFRDQYCIYIYIQETPTHFVEQNISFKASPIYRRQSLHISIWETYFSWCFDALSQTYTDQHPRQKKATNKFPFDPSNCVNPISNVKDTLTV